MSNNPALRLAEINLAAVRHNVSHLVSLVAPAKVMVVVKADGYGHGAVHIARAALEAGADSLGVADVSEALELREAGITATILAWLHDADARFDDALRGNIELGLSRSESLDALAESWRRVSLDDPTLGAAVVHLKIDTGLGRSGSPAHEWDAFFARAAELSAQGVLSVRGIMSHLANTDAYEDQAQLDAFHAAVSVARAAGLAPEVLHLASTAGAIRFPEARLDLVRIGIGAYGLSPFDDASSADLGLTPAMQVSSRVIATKEVPAGTGVSYGYSYRTSQDSHLALVGLGYADGIPRLGSNCAPVALAGSTYTVTGRIAMDQFVVDLGEDEAAVGDRVVLFGDPATGVPSADDWASAVGTINYEIVTRIGDRFEREYRG